MSQPFIEKRVRGAGHNEGAAQGETSTPLQCHREGSVPLWDPKMGQGQVGLIPSMGVPWGLVLGLLSLLPHLVSPPEPLLITWVAVKPTASPQGEPGHSGEPPPPDVTSVPLLCCVETGSSGLISLKSPTSCSGGVWSKGDCVGSGSAEAAPTLGTGTPGDPSRAPPDLRCPEEGAQCSQSMAGQWHTCTTVIRHHRAWLGTGSPCPTHPSANSISLINELAKQEHTWPATCTAEGMARGTEGHPGMPGRL